ncbi:MAG: CARDB domain-containing protein, partial [Candidatus Thorarchaeota archaeon SMTZ1-45]
MSKQVDDTRTQSKQFIECEIDPTTGSFDYTETEISFNWIDATGGTWNDLSMDEYVAIDLPFSFPFYGESFSTVYVSRNGWMSFYNTEPSHPWVWMGSSGEDSWYAVAPYATPISFLDGNPGIYNLSLTSPSCVIIEYNNVYDQSSYLVGTFQTILYENGTIDFNYDLVENIYDWTYSTGLNHGAIYDNYVSHTFASFPIDDVTLRYTPPEKWIFITSPEMTDSSDYQLTWIGHSDVAIDMYHIFLDYTFYDNTTLDYLDLTGLATGMRYIEVYMETDSFNYTVGMTLVVDLDTPIISIEFPLDGGTNLEAKVNWTAYDMSSWIAYYEVYINGSLYRTTYDFEMYLVVPNLHHYNLTVFAYDALDHSASDTVTFFYNRSITAIGFVTTHYEMRPYEIMSLYTDLGWVADEISGSLAFEGDLSVYNRLASYDAVFAGAYGSSWPTEDLDILNSYLAGGGKFVLMQVGEIPEGLATVMSDLGIGIEEIWDSAQDNTTDFVTEHPLMTGVTELYYDWFSNGLTTTFPATELIRTRDGKYVLGAVVDLGLEKVLCLSQSFSWAITQADNAILFENIITNWVGVEDHDLRAGLGAPGALGSGQTVNLTAYVLNQGNNTETGFSLELWVDGVLEDSTVVASLDPGDWTAFEVSYVVTTPGPINVTAYVEPVVGEVVTYNNVETKILDVYNLVITEPVPTQSVRGGLVYINFTATDMQNLVNITVFVNAAEVYKLTDTTFVNGSFVPVFTNGTNVISLIGDWANGASAVATVSVESYGVVPIVNPSPGDYANFLVDAPGYLLEMINFTILEWVSSFEVNSTFYVNVTQAGFPSQAFETWVVFNVLNGYISEGGTAMPPGLNLYKGQFLFFPGLSAPESAPVATSIDLGCVPTASIGDLMCFMQWNTIMSVVGSGSWNGYATHVVGIVTEYYSMTFEILQCNGMLVEMNQTVPGMSIAGEIVATNMLPPFNRAPIVNSPDDMTIAEDDTGISITWVASGNYPTTYSIYIDDVESESGS